MQVTGPTLLNDLTFDSNGNLYVTDSFAAIIYKVSAGGGAPTVWFTNPALVGHPSVGVGVNGIRIDKNDKWVYFSVTVNTVGNGVIYRLPLVPNPAASDLQLFASLGFTGPDGIAFGRSGKLYIAEALTSTIKVLRTDGSVEAVYSGQPRIPLRSRSPGSIPQTSRSTGAAEF